MAGIADKVYRHLPVPLQHAAVSAFGYHWKRLRLSGSFQSEYEGFRQREYYTRQEWSHYIEQKLKELLVTAYQTVPYYKKAWHDADITLKQLQAFTLDDLPLLPPLEKQTARDNPHSLLTNGTPPPKYHVAHTSGSTGTPVATYWTAEERQRALALREARSCGFANVSYHMPRATFSGRIVEPNPESKGPYYRFNWFEKQVYFSAFHLRPDTAQQYLNALIKHDIQWMTGYSNSIYQLAQMTLDQGLNAPQLKAIITTSEKITLGMRQVVEQAFSTKVYEEYGSVENVFYASECEYGHMHISPDAGIIEVVDENFHPVPPGEMGEVLATGFVRSYQPMIRYRIGDRAIIDTSSCPCGRQMPIIKEIVGRTEDTVYGPDGRRMVRFHGIFVDQPYIQEGQIIQEQLDLIRVKIVPKPGFSEADKLEVKQRIQQRLTSNVDVIVEEVEQIGRTSAGKYRAVISKLSPETLEKLQQH